MRIALLANSYGSLSETFVSREARALQARGHEVAAFTGGSFSGPAGAQPTCRIMPWSDEALREWRPEVLYASLGLLAHQRAVTVSRLLNLPYALRVWQGHDMFRLPTPELYSEASASQFCLGVIVEDQFSRRYAEETMRVQADKLVVVPNSIDLDRFSPRQGPRPDGPLTVLAIARFVEKKGLIHLIRAFNSLGRKDARLRIIGYGPERDNLRCAAGPNVTVEAEVRESALPDLYRSADIFAAPCIQCGNGDADGIPTTVLEAMACGLPVIASDLLSASCYVQLLTQPGNERDIADALAHLLDHPDRAERIGGAGRIFAVENLDLVKNIARIESVLERGSISRRWQDGIDAIHERRTKYTDRHREYYAEIGAKALAFLQPAGDVIDVGCGDGSMMHNLNGAVTSYTGVDPGQPDLPICHDKAEHLVSFRDDSFDTALSYSVLQHVEDPMQALREMHRVLKPGGQLALLVCVDDPNPIFLWRWNQKEVLNLVRQAGFVVQATTVLDGRHLCVRGRK